MAEEFWMNDGQWAHLSPLLPNKSLGVPRGWTNGRWLGSAPPLSRQRHSGAPLPPKRAILEFSWLNAVVLPA